jgi:hypothetical protein
MCACTLLCEQTVSGHSDAGPWSADAVVLAGQSRRWYHGLPRIFTPGVARYMVQ